jgi:hypothetical protein
VDAREKSAYEASQNGFHDKTAARIAQEVREKLGGMSVANDPVDQMVKAIGDMIEQQRAARARSVSTVERENIAGLQPSRHSRRSSTTCGARRSHRVAKLSGHSTVVYRRLSRCERRLFYAPST